MRHYENLKLEMSVDPKELSEQSKINTLQAMHATLEKRLSRITQENEEFSIEIKAEMDKLDALREEKSSLEEEMKRLEIQEENADESVKNEIKDLILRNEKMKEEEVAFKEECRRKIEELHQKIEEAEVLAATPDEEVAKYDQLLEEQNEILRKCRLQLAKKNRAVTSLQRRLDNIPDNVELAQYQKRFIELYNQINAKHKETKQFYALYNTLNDIHFYIDKELTFLNSIYDNYNQ